MDKKLFADLVASIKEMKMHNSPHPGEILKEAALKILGQDPQFAELDKGTLKAMALTLGRKQMPMDAYLPTRLSARHLEPGIGLGSSLASARFDSAGPVPNA